MEVLAVFVERPSHSCLYDGKQVQHLSAGMNYLGNVELYKGFLVKCC